MQLLVELNDLIHILNQMRILCQDMNQILALIVRLHHNICALSSGISLPLINYIEQLNDLSLAYVVNNHLDLIIARLNKQVLKLYQVVFEHVTE